MFDKNQFRAAVIAAGKSMSDVAKALNINEATLYRKISRNGDFSRNEIRKIIDFLHIENPMGIFFNEQLA